MMTLLSSVVSLSRMSVMDDTLTEPKKMVTKLNRKSMRAPREVGSPQCTRTESRKSQESFAVPVFCVACQHSPSGTYRTQILTTLQTFRQRTYIAHQHADKRLQDCRHAISCHAVQILPSTSESTAQMRISSSLISLWLRPNSRASSSRSSNFPLQSHTM